MTRYIPHLLSFWRLTRIISGLLLVVFGGFYFFNVSAQTETEVVEKPAEQNLAPGRLAFSSYFEFVFPPRGKIITANPDGSGQIVVTLLQQLAGEPAWSPDGTKLAFSMPQAPYDISVINANGSGAINLTNTTNIRERNPSWSVMGKIAYQRALSTSPDSTTIWVINPDGSGNAQFSGITQPSPTGPAWSPDGTQLAFASGGHIWVINADGTNELRLTPPGYTASAPAWSPDGSQIVFRRANGIAIVGGIRVINANGKNERALTSNNSDQTPAWSPDGTKIAFGRNGNDIYTMDADGSNEVMIVNGVANIIKYENPAWQPPVAHLPNTFSISGRVANTTSPVSGITVNLTGTTTAAIITDEVGNYQFSNLPAGGNYTVTPSFPNYFFSPASRTFNNLAANQTDNFEVAAVCIGARCVKNGKLAYVNNGEIYTIPLEGAGQTNITNNPASDGEPNYSPNGSSIIFTTNRDGNSEIYRMNADGGNPVRLTNNPASDTQPYYSPNGASIVFVSNRDGNNEIYRMSADGTNQVRLTNNTTGDTYPAFSPDGLKLVFVNSGTGGGDRANLWTMSADGSNQQPLGTPTGIVPAYQRPSYSPDGSKIIYTYTPDVQIQPTAWTMNSDGTNRTQLFAFGLSASYSPDGTKVVYVCCSGGNQLYTANADSSFAQILPLSPYDVSFPVWQPLPLIDRTPFDYDGDGRADVSVFRPSENKWYILQSSTLSLRDPKFAVAGDIPTPADYDGDGKTDAAIFRPSSGDWWYLSSINNAQIYVHWGQSGDIPRPSDIDGDGKTDFVVYRPSNNYWYRLLSTGETSFIKFGIAEDKPLIGDFDGDGKDDPVIFRPSTGAWWYAVSSEGNAVRTVNWGVSGDLPVPGDYDADGRTDFVVYRPSDGGWYILYSTGSYTITTFGLPDDKPVAADYDGDGKADIAVWRPSTGTWYLLQTTAGFGALQWGISNDIPTESAFIP